MTDGEHGLLRSLAVGLAGLLRGMSTECKEAFASSLEAHVGALDASSILTPCREKGSCETCSFWEPCPELNRSKEPSKAPVPGRDFDVYEGPSEETGSCERGECRKSAPTGYVYTYYNGPGDTKGTTRAWTVTEAADWCGEHEWKE